MLRWLLVLLLIPFLDAVLLAIVVSQTEIVGWVGMVLFVVLTGLVGMLLVRAEGRRTLRKTQQSLADGKPPTNQLLDGALLIAAGAFLLTPGIVTDLIGFLLVVPPTRIPIRVGLKRFVIVPYLDTKTSGFASGAVWTYGFPEDGQTRPENGFDESTKSGFGGDDTRSKSGQPYDLSSDAYSIDDSDVRETTETDPPDDDSRDG